MRSKIANAARQTSGGRAREQHPEAFFHAPGGTDLPGRVVVSEDAVERRQRSPLRPASQVPSASGGTRAARGAPARARLHGINPARAARLGRLGWKEAQ